LENDPFIANLSTDSTQLFLIEGDKAVSSEETAGARYRDWEQLVWRKTGHSPVGSAHYRQNNRLYETIR